MCTFDGGIKLVQALWEPVWMLQIKIELLYDLTVPLVEA